MSSQHTLANKLKTIILQERPVLLARYEDGAITVAQIMLVTDKALYAIDHLLDSTIRTARRLLWQLYHFAGITKEDSIYARIACLVNTGPYERRLKSTKLQKMPMDKLRRQALKLNIDTTGFTHKWHFVHTIMIAKLHERSKRFRKDPDRKSFLDLPAEMRNEIYDLVLVSSDITMIYINENTEQFQGSRPIPFGRRSGFESPTFDHVRALLLLSALSRQVRMEARSYFYLKNTITIFAQPHIAQAWRHLARLQH